MAVLCAIVCEGIRRVRLALRAAAAVTAALERARVKVVLETAVKVMANALEKARVKVSETAVKVMANAKVIAWETAISAMHVWKVMATAS